MLRFGPDNGPVAIMALPLFEEANRTRAFAVAILRALAAHDIASVLPDMPGQGESLVPLESVTLADMKDAHRALGAAVGSRHRDVYAVAIRSGALLDRQSDVRGRWYLAPQDGPALHRELERIKQADIGARGSPIDTTRDISVEIAGNLIGTSLLAELSACDDAAIAAPTRTVRLDSDPLAADRKLMGSALWRRSEPGNDLTLAQLLGADIAEWIATCGG